MATQTIKVALALVLATAGSAHAQVANPNAPRATTPAPVTRATTAQALGSEILLPPTGDLACRSVLVRLWVSEPPSGAFPLLSGFASGTSEDPVTVGRARCLQLLDDPLVLFENDIPPSPRVPTS